eukprot:2250472-Pleurochrysis_carterae.AAC.3
MMSASSSRRAAQRRHFPPERPPTLVSPHHERGKRGRHHQAWRERHTPSTTPVQQLGYTRRNR